MLLDSPYVPWHKLGKTPERWPSPDDVQRGLAKSATGSSKRDHGSPSVAKVQVIDDSEHDLFDEESTMHGKGREM
jgi:hypothetical protein